MDEPPQRDLDRGGSYNFGSETDQSMYEIAKEFAECLGKEIAVEDIPPRRNLWMDCSKARNAGVVFSSVLDGLKLCAEEFHRWTACE